MNKTEFLAQYGDEHHITKALDDTNADVRRTVAIKHPNVATEHLNKALGNKDWMVRCIARWKLQDLA